MAMYPCYFGGCGSKRSDRLRDHCARVHPSGPDVVSAGKNEVGFTFHFLDGHTDRVWATCRGKESPKSIAHCFVCHTFFEKGGYKTIEEATAAHTCNPAVGKERAKRGPKPAGGAGTTPTPGTPVGKGMWLTGDYLVEMWKESSYGVKGSRALEVITEEDGEVNIPATLDKLVEDVIAKAKADMDNVRLRKEIEELKAGIVPTTGEMDWSIVFNHCKSRYSPIKQWYPKILEAAQADKEADEPLGERFLLALIEFTGDMARKVAESQKEADRLEAERLAASNQQMATLQRNMTLEADVRSYQRDIASLQAEVARLQAAQPQTPVEGVGGTGHTE